MCNLDKDHEKLNGYSDADLNEEKKDGNRFKLIEKDPWDTVEEKFPIGSKVRGVVSHFEDDGALVELEEGVGGFVHRSEISWVDNDAPKELLTVGEEIDVVVLAVNKEEKAIFLSIKRATKDSWEAVEEKYPIGLKVRGVVSRLTKNGAFVKIGQGFRGIVHKNEISWIKKFVAPKKLLTVGEEIDVVVLAVNKEEKAIFLSIKRTTKDPWDTFVEKYTVGSKVRGVVSRLMDYGAFVELEEGVNGLVHVGEMSWTRYINHPSELLTVGEEIEVVILEINKEEKKLALSIKRTTKDPWDTVEEEYPIGSKVRGVVSHFVADGAFVKFGQEFRGIVHIEEMYWTRRINHPSELLTVGEEIEVVILEINKEEKKISLSLRKAKKDPWDTVRQKYSEGSEVRGVVRETNMDTNKYHLGIVPQPYRFVDLNDIWVELEDGLIGKVPNIEIERYTSVGPSDPKIPKIGEEIEVVIIGIKEEEKMIYLSLCDLHNSAWVTFARDFVRYKAKVGVIDDSKVVVYLGNVRAVLPISEISWTRYFDKPSEALKKNQEIRVKVIETTYEKILVSLKRAGDRDEPLRSIYRGSTYSGVIIGHKNGNALVELDYRVVGRNTIIELDDGVVGLLPMIEKLMLSNYYSINRTIKVTVIENDIQNESLLLGDKFVDKVGKTIAIMIFKFIVFSKRFIVFSKRCDIYFVLHTVAILTLIAIGIVFLEFISQIVADHLNSL